MQETVTGHGEDRTEENGGGENIPLVEIEGGRREEDTEEDTRVSDNIVVNMMDEGQAEEDVNKDEDTGVS